MTDPHISVLLPTLNAANTVATAIKSIRRQTYDDWDLHIIDGGSSDGTKQVVNEVADPRVHWHELEGRNIAAALNYGIEVSDGELIARQDADDRSMPERFSAQVHRFENEPAVGMVGTGATLVDGDGNRRGQRVTLERVAWDDLECKNRFVHGSVMIRREAVERVNGYDERFDYSEDYDLWLRLVEYCDLVNIPWPLYELTIRDDSAYGSDLLLSKLYGRAAVRGESPPASLTAGLNQLPPSERAGVFQSAAQEELRYENRRQAAKLAAKALRNDPTNVMAAGVLGLSVAPTAASQWVIQKYRQRINDGIRQRNSQAQRVRRQSAELGTAEAQ